jgi:hypothetical protein
MPLPDFAFIRVFVTEPYPEFRALRTSVEFYSPLFLWRETKSKRINVIPPSISRARNL